MIVGVGIDVVPVARFAAALRRTPGLADRLFTAAEQVTDSGAPRSPESLAARFAAKEALAKALGAPGGMLWTDAEVRTDAAGRPSLVVVGHGGRGRRVAGRHALAPVAVARRRGRRGHRDRRGRRRRTGIDDRRLPGRRDPGRRDGPDGPAARRRADAAGRRTAWPRTACGCSAGATARRVVLLVGAGRQRRRRALRRGARWPAGARG